MIFDGKRTFVSISIFKQYYWSHSSILSPVSSLKPFWCAVPPVHSPIHSFIVHPSPLSSLLWLCVLISLQSLHFTHVFLPHFPPVSLLPLFCISLHRHLRFSEGVLSSSSVWAWTSLLRTFSSVLFMEIHLNLLLSSFIVWKKKLARNMIQNRNWNHCMLFKIVKSEQNSVSTCFFHSFSHITSHFICRS